VQQPGARGAAAAASKRPALPGHLAGYSGYSNAGEMASLSQ